MAVSYALFEKIYGAGAAAAQRDKNERQQASWDACFGDDYDAKFTDQQRTPEVVSHTITNIGARAVHFAHQEHGGLPDLPDGEHTLIKPYGIWGLVAPYPRSGSQL